MKATVLFACVHNAGRSQMAAGFFNAIADPNLARAISAGTQPAVRVHPEVVDAMREVGIELDGVSPTLLTDELAAGAQWLVTMGCGETCPVVHGLRRLEWDLPDPKGEPPQRVQAIRDEIRIQVERLIAAQGWRRGSEQDATRRLHAGSRDPFVPAMACSEAEGLREIGRPGHPPARRWSVSAGGRGGRCGSPVAAHRWQRCGRSSPPACGPARCTRAAPEA
ncbi:MAG: hypothetical protein HY899_19260 [Deltaproteobacteria bacterium]|nr:hypothetical protein [Deltaproteobacteria bacterium]